MKPVGSMNLDELLKTVCAAESIDNQASVPAHLVHDSSFNRDSSKKTIEEVWREILLENRNGISTLGGMTLEEFLAQAVVSVEKEGQNSELIQYQMLPQNGRDSGVEKMVDRRHKRMIKNRESAARSRARRQAYTQELENKVVRLEEENKRLKRIMEVEQVLPIALPPEPKFKLGRTSSSPL